MVGKKHQTEKKNKAKQTNKLKTQNVQKKVKYNAD